MGNKIYLAGPITGLDWENEVLPAFKKAEQECIERGWKVISPIYHKKPKNMERMASWDVWQHFMREALISLSQVDAIYMLPGWEKSKGARLEYDIAIGMGYPVIGIWHIEDRVTFKEKEHAES